MKRTLLGIVPAVLSFLALVLIVATLLQPARVSAASNDKIVNVDYVIGLLDAGVDQSKIIDRIEQRGLTLRLAPGDMDRLRAAGADDKLIDSVIDHAAVLEGQGGTPSKAGQEQPPAQDTGRWGRPSRLGNSGGGAGSNDAPATPGREQTTPPPVSEEQQYQQSDEDGQGIIEEEPYGGSYAYYPGYYDFYYGYPYPYYYYPYPYSSYFYYSYPSYHYYPRHYYHGGSVRGGGGIRTSPRGGHMGMPRSGGGFHSAPRSHPRGSHR